MKPSLVTRSAGWVLNKAKQSLEPDPTSEKGEIVGWLAVTVSTVLLALLAFEALTGLVTDAISGISLS